MGINCEHSGPWFDLRAEDHPLAGGGDERNRESFHQHYWCFLWKGADFMNGGDRFRVSFDDSSRPASVYYQDEARTEVPRHAYAFRALKASNNPKDSPLYEWEFQTKGPVESSPWPGHGAVYVGSDDGFIYALR